MKSYIVPLILTAASINVAHAGDWSTYRVTITNATAHQVLTPPLLVTHNSQFELFSIGSPASEALATQAESGNPEPLHMEAAGSHGVFDSITGTDVIAYGQSASFDISAPKKGNLSVTAMLATTNDGFAAISGVALPKRSARYFAYAYDAGSEANNESCSHVPGPPCAEDSGNERTAHGEGFVTIHNGIHGGSDLNPKQLDWRGPVAVITIQRLHD